MRRIWISWRIALKNFLACRFRIDMQIHNLSINGSFFVEFDEFKDERGLFVKTFNRNLFEGTSLASFSTEEEFFTISNKNVLRGLHFQTPPAEHNKFVYCINGQVSDVLFDLRKESTTYGRHCVIELDSSRMAGVYIPKGIAHGFLSRADNSTLIYKVDSGYDPGNDMGLRWDSCGINWDVKKPILSDRDQQFPSFSEYLSPF